MIADNTLASPALCQPMKHGVDIVIHSCTKFIGGHGTSIGGMIIERGDFPWDNGKFPELTEPDPSYHGMKFFETFGPMKLAYILKARTQLLRDFGAAMSPFNAFLFLQGLETLHLRMKAHSENALAVAQFLESHSKVSWVNYTGLDSHPSYNLGKKYLPNGSGAILGFGNCRRNTCSTTGKRCKIDQSGEIIFSWLMWVTASRLLSILQVQHINNSLRRTGPATGVTPDFVRLSIGTEDINDIIGDLKQALDAV